MFLDAYLVGEFFTDKKWLDMCARLDEERKIRNFFGWKVKDGGVSDKESTENNQKNVQRED